MIYFCIFIQNRCYKLTMNRLIFHVGILIFIRLQPNDQNKFFSLNIPRMLGKKTLRAQL